MLHLQCELPAALRPLLARWWEDFHFPELLSLPGFLHARRGELIAPDGCAPIVTMYGLADPAAADQPRPAEFTLMPSELDGRVTFRRRIFQRVSDVAADTEPVAGTFLQLLRPAAGGSDLPDGAEQLRQWPGVVAASGWRTVVNAPHTDRAEVVHLRETELIHAELAADDSRAHEYVARCRAEFPGWEASAYRQASLR